MSMEDCFPHYDFDFNKIRQYWKLALGNYAAAKKYLQVVQRRLEYWTKEQGPWIDFDFAAKHLVDDLHVSDAESRLMWLALQRRARLANEQGQKHSRSNDLGNTEEIGVSVRHSKDGQHDAIWYEDFCGVYLKALARERRELRRLRDVGMIAATEEERRQGSKRPGRANQLDRPRLRWMWANRLLAYLFEALREEEAICDDGEMWAALDGAFTDKHGQPITRKDLALWAHQYHNNKACGDEVGKPKRYELVDAIIERIQGEKSNRP